MAESISNLARLYYAQNWYVQAEPLYKRALAINEKSLDPNHPDVVTSLEELAALYRKTGQTVALKELERRLESYGQ